MLAPSSSAIVTSTCVHDGDEHFVSGSHPTSGGHNQAGRASGLLDILAEVDNSGSYVAIYPTRMNPGTLAMKLRRCR